MKTGRLRKLNRPREWFLYCQVSLGEDFTRIIEGGPRFINGQYFTVILWQPDLNPRREKISITTIWARFMGLLADYYDRIILQRVGNQLGKLLKVDARTTNMERGLYPRICV